MKFFTNKNITKKLIIMSVFLILFTFAYPKDVKAISTEEITNTILTGTAKLFFSIFDGAMETLNSIFMGYDSGGIIYLSPENIIKGKFILTEANIFKNTNINDYYDTSTEAKFGRDTNEYSNKIYNGRVNLRKNILGWYYNLRNLAIVAMLSILVYVAIRMILSSVSSDKAKYKMMLKDWLVAVCLIFVMHYIMIAVLGITDTITQAISGGNSTNMAQKTRSEISSLLFSIDYEEKSDKEVSDDLSKCWGKIFVYAAIFVFTLIFTIKYIIRALTIIFLTLLAPISCITYPIDKMGDGKSQAFDFWFKEFFMEVIIQPFHLLLYMVLIGASLEMADANIVYSIMCFAIMLPAEKFIKQMFGINEKLGSPLADMASVAAASGLAKKAAGMLRSGNNGKKGGNSSNSDNDDAESALPPRQKSSLDAYNEGEGNSDNGNGSQQQRVTSGNNSSNYDDDQATTTAGGNNGELSGSNDSQVDAGINDINRQIDREALEEQIADGQINPQDLTPEQQALLGNNNENSNVPNENPSRRDSTNEISNANNTNQQEIDNNKNNNKQLEEEQNNIEDSTQNNNNQLPENERTSIQRKREPKPVRKLQQARNAIKTEIGKGVRKKYGTTRVRGKNGLGVRALKSAPKALGKVLSGATRLTLAGGAAGILGMMALATGDYKKVLGAVGAGAALGNAAGKKINGYRTNINGKIGKYSQVGIDAMKGENSKREEQKQKYMQNQKERNYVEQYLQDKNGYIPSGKEINEEMEKRWNYQEAGITDRDIIDSARDLAEQKEIDFLNGADYTEEQRNNYNDTEQMLFDNQEGMDSQIRYRDAYEQLQKGDMTNEEFNREFGEGEAEKARDHQIMEDKAQGKRKMFENQALYAASIANSISKSDFMDKKKMQNLQESNIQDYMQACKAQGKSCTRAQAESLVNSAINDAAKIKGIKSGANLPDVELKPKTQTQSQQHSKEQAKPQSTTKPQSQTKTISQPQQQTKSVSQNQEQPQSPTQPKTQPQNNVQVERKGRKTKTETGRSTRNADTQQRKEVNKREIAGSGHQENRQGEKSTNGMTKGVRDSKGSQKGISSTNRNQQIGGPTNKNVNKNNGPIV